jgi:hypothetical protein
MTYGELKKYIKEEEESKKVVIEVDLDKIEEGGVFTLKVIDGKLYLC